MVLACAYHPDGLEAFKFADHPWRKPGPGMLFEAAAALGLDLPSSVIVGDCLSDMRAGAAAGLSSGMLVRTGHGNREWEAGGQQMVGSLARGFGFAVKRSDDAAAAIMDWLAKTVSKRGD